jgi:cytochrome c peroxidase
MIDRKLLALTLLSAMVLLLVISAGTALAQGPTPIEELGKFLYFDTNLSNPSGQACASCHDPSVGFDDPDSDMPVSQGVLPENHWGNRNSPASAYAMYAPLRDFDQAEGLWIGGQFWDGRATGEVLGDPLADQALGPFLNPLEMNNPNKNTVIEAVKLSDYADLFEQVWGPGSLDDVEAAYDQVALSIAAFERTNLFAKFTSRYDDYLAKCLELKGDMNDCAQGVGSKAARAARDMLTDQEWFGLQLFMGDNNNDGVREKREGALCSGCHIAEWTAAELNVVVPDWAPDGWVPPVFTDFTFDNLGVPKNWDSPFLDLPTAFNPDGPDFIDYGLGGSVGDPAENGKFKVMTLRNIAVTAPYAHNGYFATLEDITNFYNSRDVPGAGWDAPEVPATVNHDELGNLGLSEEDVAALVAFMETLTDANLAE